jgi:hypothetical protein
MNILAGGAVQGTGRLVSEQEVRAIGQGPGYGHSLLLAARELGGAMMDAFAKPDLA